MSFNNRNIHLTPENYQEYFLLYVDDELSIEEREVVESYIELNPHLQAELDSFLSSKLPVENISMENKQFLLSENMKHVEVDESLLLYIDNELDKEGKVRVEELIRNNGDYQLQYQLLKKSKLDYKDTIIYPYKKELYKSTGALRPFYLFRIAAAIILILSLGAILWITNSDEQPASIVQKPVTNETRNNVIHQEQKTLSEDDKDNITSVQATDIALDKEPKTQNRTYKKEEVSTGVQKPVTSEKEMQIARITEQSKTKKIVEQTKSKETTEIAKVKEPINPQQNIHKTPVTSEDVITYINTEAPVNTAVTFASNEEDKKGSVRGFLRKATRFIERRTGVNPVNEDDELLIGVVAIKL